MSAFWQYCGISGVLAVASTAAVIAALFVGITVPAELYALVGLAFGSSFRSQAPAVVEAPRK